MWFTDTQITAIPAFQGLAPEQIAQLAADAGRLYQQITAQPGITDTDLRTWAEQAGMTPERYNTAAQAIAQAGKAVDISAGPIASSRPATPHAALRDALSGPPSVPVERLTVGELRTIADRLKLDVAKSATKADLAKAIAQST